ncbi:MAG: sensor histidine kinase [Rubrivivax sp.]|nr:MAG: sensor histidine kinase [Rubrivivax sp.]
MEWAVGRDSSHRYGLLINLIYALCLGYWCWTLLGIVWLSDARRRWQQLPDARQRFDRGGVYALVGWPAIVLCVVFGIPVASIMGVAMAQAALALPWPVPVPTQRPPFGVSLVLSYSSAVVTFTVDYLRVRLAASEVRAEAAQRQAVEAQLQLLQAQLEPHMLFNTLANLHALIETEPARAQEMLARLIAFLRSTLSASRVPAHPLSDEFTRVADYLALMQIRMGSRLQVLLELPADLSGLLVPPLLLQPLVENAIQHGLEPSRRGGQLTVRAEHDGNHLILCVNDTGRGVQAAQLARRGMAGFGLSCVRDRLQTLYGGAASLILEPPPIGPGTCVTLRLPVLRPTLPAIAALP